MARYSPIAPITLLEEMQTENILGNYLLLLAHDVLKEPMRYESLILHMRSNESLLPHRSQQTFIIMDNSVIELGAAMHADDVIEAACVVEANCIMTPDALGGFGETVSLVEDQAELLENCGFPLMRVPQGNTQEELQTCVAWLRDYLPAEDGKPEYWGIPRWIANKLSSRAPLIQYINTTSSGPLMHLLGMSDNYEDDIHCVHQHQVMGIDSANPVVMGMDNMGMKNQPVVHMARGDYWQQTVLAPAARFNVEWVHNACKQRP